MVGICAQLGGSNTRSSNSKHRAGIVRTSHTVQRPSVHLQYLRPLTLLAVLAASTTSFGADANHLNKLAAMRECKGCDLSGATLTFGSFKNADLSGADLTGAKLKGADFYSASLKGARLAKADLTEVNFNGTDLTGADLKGANLYRVNLLGARLTDADLSEVTNLGKISIGEAVLCRTLLPSGIENRDCK